MNQSNQNLMFAGSSQYLTTYCNGQVRDHVFNQPISYNGKISWGIKNWSSCL